MSKKSYRKWVKNKNIFKILNFVILLFCYFVILLFCYFVIFLFCYFVILLFCYFVILLLCYFVILLFCYFVILLFCYFVILFCLQRWVSFQWINMWEISKHSCFYLNRRKEEINISFVSNYEQKVSKYKSL